MYLKSIELSGFKSFGKKTELVFGSRISGIVGPNGSGKCVTGDTLVRTRRTGTDEHHETPLVALKPGDEVMSYDESAETFVWSRVTQLLYSGTKKTYHVHIGGRSVRASDNHPFLTREGWRPLRDLHTGAAVAIPQLRTYAFVDASNVYYATKRLGWDIDYEKLARYLRERLGVTKMLYFGGIAPENPGQVKFHEFLRRIGYEICLVPTRTFPDGKRKADVDARMTFEMMRLEKEFDRAVVLTGDGDFYWVLEHLKTIKERVWLVGASKGTAHELKQLFHGSARIVLENIRSIGARDTTQNADAQRHRRSVGGKSTDDFSPGVVQQSYGRRDDLSMKGVGKPVAWENVRSITPVGMEDVWDIEVEGTHNFVGNGIILHNSNVAEGFRFVLGEQSMKSMRSKRGEDLIWGGSPALPRMNRAVVKVVFDNSKKLLDIDFSEVVIERIVHRDGQNEYLLNGSQVRLKDVIRLLAGANIGGSGYQIISQGEADRILNASPKERREMVEDALGLKLYQHKKAESERKLEETGVNIDKTKSLRREIAPHLNFLRTQVEKIEKARELKEQLAAKLNEYLAREHAWISQEDARLSEEIRAHETELRKLSEGVRAARGTRGSSSDAALAGLQGKLTEREGKLAAARRESERLARELGRAEGALEANNVTVEAIVPVPHVRNFARELDATVSELEHTDDVAALKSALTRIRDRLRSFIEGLTGAAPIP